MTGPECILPFAATSAIGSLLLSSFVPLACSLLLHSSVFSLLAASVFARPLRLLTASAFVRLLTARCFRLRPSASFAHCFCLRSSFSSVHCFCLRSSSSFAHCFCLTTYVWPSLVGRHTGRLTSLLFARYCFTYLISFSSARSHAPVTPPASFASAFACRLPLDAAQSSLMILLTISVLGEDMGTLCSGVLTVDMSMPSARRMRG